MLGNPRHLHHPSRQSYHTRGTQVWSRPSFKTFELAHLKDFSHTFKHSTFGHYFSLLSLRGAETEIEDLLVESATHRFMVRFFIISIQRASCVASCSNLWLCCQLHCLRRAFAVLIHLCALVDSYSGCHLFYICPLLLPLTFPKVSRSSDLIEMGKKPPPNGIYMYIYIYIYKYIYT